MSPDAHAQTRSDAALTYYDGGPRLSGVVLGALRAAGRNLDPLDPDDLAALDEFHGLGRAATLALADLAGISDGDRVLDVGAGIGGPARTLAVHRGAHVTALDPVDRFCELNQQLCRHCGLEQNVEVVRGDARSMPVGDAQFDVVWTQAVWPSIDDKHAMVHEMHRVSKPGGRLALYEITSGPAAGDLHFPVPWANGPTESFLLSPDDVRSVTESAGFTVREWLEGPDVLARIGETAGSGRPGMATGVEGITLALVMPDFDERMAGLARNVADQRISMVMALFTRT